MRIKLSMPNYSTLTYSADRTLLGELVLRVLLLGVQLLGTVEADAHVLARDNHRVDVLANADNAQLLRIVHHCRLTLVLTELRVVDAENVLDKVGCHIEFQLLMD